MHETIEKRTARYLLDGYELVAAPMLSDVIRVKRHRKRRIDKKWLKRYGYKSVPRKCVLVSHNEKRIYAHPEVLFKVAEFLERR